MCRVRYKSKPCRYCGTAVTCFHKFETCRHVDPGNVCPNTLQEYHSGPTDRDVCYTCDLQEDQRRRERTGDVRYEMVVPGLSKAESKAKVKRWRDENTEEGNLILREFLEQPDHADAQAAGEWLLQQPYHEPSFRTHGTPEGVVLHHFHPGLRSGYYDPRRVPNAPPDSYAAYPGSANWAHNDRSARRRSEDRRRMPPPPAPATTSAGYYASATATVTTTTTAGQYYYPPPVATTTVGGGGGYDSYDGASDQASDAASTYYAGSSVAGTSAADSLASSRTAGTSSHWAGVGSSRHHGQRGGSGAGGSSTSGSSSSSSSSSHRHHHGSSHHGSSSSGSSSSSHRHPHGSSSSSSHHGSSHHHGSSRHGSRHH